MSLDNVDGWPDAQGIPWQELIRIRYLYQVDVLVLAAVQRAVASRLPAGSGREFARQATGIAAAVGGGHRDPQELPEARLGAVVGALADFDDDWCGTRPRPWPHRAEGAEGDRSPWQAGGLAEVVLAIDAATRLAANIGTPDLQRALGTAMEATLAQLEKTQD
jgi:hypothetical protein